MPTISTDAPPQKREIGGTRASGSHNVKTETTAVSGPTSVPLLDRTVSQPPFGDGNLSPANGVERSTK